MDSAMHIVVAGPIATAELAECLFSSPEATQLPAGYLGAPLTSILVRELLQRGHQVTAITHDASLPPNYAATRRARGPGLEMVVTPCRPRAWRPQAGKLGRAMDGFRLEVAWLARAMREAKADVVHAHWTYEFALAALASGLPHLITCHDSPNEILRITRSPYRAVRWCMANSALKHARLLTAVSPYLTQSLPKAVQSRLTVVPNPVDWQALRAGTDRSLQGAPRVAMVCSSWDRLKNAKAGIQAFAMWRKSRPDAQLHVFGQDFGPSGRAEQWATQHMLAGGIHFHGRKVHQELLQALSHSDALLHPSLQESFGVVVAEAMALGLPVIGGAGSGAVPWVMGAGEPPIGGILADVTSPADMARALEQVFCASYGELSRAARRRASTYFSPESIVNAYVRLYRVARTDQAAA